MPATRPADQECTADLSVAAFVRRHQRELWRYARGLGCGEAEVDELVQHAFVAIWQTGRIEEHPGRDGALLRKIMRDRWVDERRLERRRRERTAEAVDAIWSQQPDGDQALDALAQCRDELTGRPRQIVAAFYGQQLGRDEVAAALGMKPNGVKTLLQRTRAALRECVRRRLQGEPS
ncbi:MAG: sigma-70 family RNA polymerase sigma factor [Planctomycetes bacterium]|nr:sigma-70 family RNA polymerase sigma factor [Planctomycetota bacterium]